MKLYPVLVFYQFYQVSREYIYPKLTKVTTDL